MINFITGDIFDYELEAIVNPVNTFGVSGKGLALAFKLKYPANYEYYRSFCLDGELIISNILPYQDVDVSKQPPQLRLIINFPTKQHWKNPSQLEWISQGLYALRQLIIQRRINSIGIPALGCGEGGLRWYDVRSEIVNYLQDLYEVNIFVFEPADM